jgi:hypothetical protein
MKMWKDYEFGYCMSLVRTCGNGDVPFFLVRNYLAIQASDAFKVGETAIAEALTAASNHIAANDWNAAYDVLENANV